MSQLNGQKKPDSPLLTEVHALSDSQSYAHFHDNTAYDAHAYDASATAPPLRPPPAVTSRTFSTRAQDMVHRLWVAELVSWTSSAVALVTMLGVLAVYDNEWIESWPLSWKINSVVGTLNTLLRACVMIGVAAALGQLKWLWYRGQYRPLADFEAFDTASRSPVGAVRFLFTKGPFHLASWGALIVILTLFLDTFTQQVITTVRTDLFYRGQAWIVRSNHYGEYSAYSSGFQPGDQGPSTAMVGSIWEGLFGATSVMAGHIHGNIADLVPLHNCPSGNCTWGRVQTLAVCRTCEDISDQMVPARRNGNDGWQIPSGYWIEKKRGLFAMGGTSIPDENILSRTKLNLTNAQPFITYFSVLANNVTEKGSGPGAAECALSWCVVENDTSMTNGVLNQTQLTIWGNPTTPTKYGQSENIYIIPDRCHINGSDHAVRSPECIYSVDATTQRALQNYLPMVLNGTAYWEGDGWVINTVVAQAMYTLMSRSKDVFTAFDTTMNYLTSYMTRNVRMNTPNSWYNTNTGDIVNFDYKYHVRWIWMLLPAALVALTFIFLVTTIVRSRGQEKWKASSLAMLYNSIDEQHRIDFGPSAGITDLHRAAEKRQFTLVPRTHKKDYRLVGQEEHGVVYERHAGS